MNTKAPGVILLLTVFSFWTGQICLSQIHSATSAHTTYTGHSMTGYQGWFGTPGDGGTNSWRHYKGGDGFKPGSASIEYWPDMREADEVEKYLTSYVKADGMPCYVFSSVHPKTVSRHFQWMKEYGIDGAFMQRFRSDWGLKTTMNKILANALAAAREHDRAISLMYDIGTNIHIDGVPNDALRTEEVNKIFDDWKALVDDLGLTTGGDDQPYLYHNAKPLVVLWGVGFKHRHTTTGLDMQFWVELVDSLQNSPEYGGCSIMLGVPTSWRMGGGDCVSGSEHTKMLELIRSVDIIQPWHTSRFSRAQMQIEFKNLVQLDIAWCDGNGIDYTPTVSPGIREKILHENNYEKPRDGGYYFWDMARAAIAAGSEMLYLGMFDEVDEGTQYHKIDNNPPPYRSNLSFATYGGDPEDHYLWLAGEATRALRGEFVMGTAFRERADDTDFQSNISFSDLGSDYEMNLAGAVPGRKVFYADPYKVPDGAPTVGTLRDTSLFASELSDQAVTFPADQRGRYIRLVEVDALADTIMAYQAIVGTHGFAQVPYVTSFEKGSIDHTYWTRESDNNAGRVEVSSLNEPLTGKYHLTMDSREAGTEVTNSVDLYLDMESILTDILLEFSFKTSAAGADPGDGVYFSDDGGMNFVRVSGFQGTPGAYTDTVLNLSELATAAGLSLSDNFVIRFMHRDSQAIPLGGLALDDIRILHSGIQSGFAQFSDSDTVTQGAWHGIYGVDGHLIVAKDTMLPEEVSIFWDPASRSRIWEDSSSDARGLQFKPDTTILSARYADDEDHPWWFSVDVGTQETNVSLYFLDGDSLGRSFVLNVTDYATGDRYDVQTLSGFEGGIWYTWKIRGKVRFTMDTLEGPDAVVSGIFFSPYTPSALEVTHHLSFDGVDDYVDCGRGEALQISGSEITLEAWFKMVGTKADIYQSTILAMDHGESGNDVGYFMRANGDGQIEWGFGDGTWHQLKSEDGVQLFEPDTWNHVAGVYEGNYQKIYLNGNLVHSSDPFTATISPAPSEHLYIGSSPSFSGRVIEAGLTEVRIWNIARTDEEIREFATKRILGDETGLAAYWPMNEGKGQSITDMTGKGNEGILGGDMEHSLLDPVWKREPIVKYIDVMEGFNGSFEDDFNFWRFFEVPNPLGSTHEIIQGDVVHGANAAKVSYVEPDETLADRALDLWDANIPLIPGNEYSGAFWAKTDSTEQGQLNMAYGFFDQGRSVISEAGLAYELTKEYTELTFEFTPPEGTAKGWLAFRWKDEGSHVTGVVYMDHVQLWTLQNILVESIDITAPADTIDIAELIHLSAEVLPDSATEIGIAWSLSSTEDSTVARIDSRGFVTGLAEGSVTVLATALDESGIVGTYDLHVRGPVGIYPRESIQVSLYPNPSKGTLNIVSDQGYCSYTIWSILGQAVQKGEFYRHTSLKVGHLNNGLYMIEIATDRSREILRFIKE